MNQELHNVPFRSQVCFNSVENLEHFYPEIKRNNTGYSRWKNHLPVLPELNLNQLNYLNSIAQFLSGPHLLWSLHLDRKYSQA